MAAAGRGAGTECGDQDCGTVTTAIFLGSFALAAIDIAFGVP
jgi:hypothetical protein